MYSPLYTAPTPGMNPSPSAAPGFGAPGGGGVGYAYPALGCAGLDTTRARHSSQYNAPRISRAQCAQSALPQFRQYPVASISVWTAHFIELSFPVHPRAERRPAPRVAANSDSAAILSGSFAPAAMARERAAVPRAPDCWPAASGTEFRTPRGGRSQISRCARTPDARGDQIGRAS